MKDDTFMIYLARAMEGSIEQTQADTSDCSVYVEACLTVSLDRYALLILNEHIRAHIFQDVSLSQDVCAVR